MPCERSSRIRAATSSSSVTTMPPSPTARFLFEKKLNAPARPKRPEVPAGEPRPGGVGGVLEQDQPRSAASAASAGVCPGWPP